MQEAKVGGVLNQIRIMKTERQQMRCGGTSGPLAVAVAVWLINMGRWRVELDQDFEPDLTRHG